ncbi:MAG: M23 family metallopeptidase [Polyangiaceae bacterium]
MRGGTVARSRAFGALVAVSCLVGCSGKSAVVMGFASDLAASASKPDAKPDAAAALDSLPELQKVRPQDPPEAKKRWVPEDAAFVYPLPFDWGIRKDSGGTGSFLAPRAHGKHNGIDFLAPVGTPLIAACSGKAKSATRGGYGKTVQLVCKLPADLGGDDGLYASFFYAHLEKTGIGDKYESVTAGDKIGSVGKTGNAAGPEIMPHLHLEVIIRGSESEALSENHKGLEAKAKHAADVFFAHVQEECLEPAGFTSNDAIRRERRVDPFILLMCASKPKPKLEAPSNEALRDAAVKWSQHYASTGFDVDEGPHE